MWFIGIEVEQETSAPPTKKKSWIRPFAHPWHLLFLVCYFNLPLKF